MADPQAPAPRDRNARGGVETPAHDAPETSVGRKSSASVELGIPLEPGQSGTEVHREPDHGLTVDIEGDKAGITRVDSSKEEAVKLDKDGKPIPAAPGAETTPAAAPPLDLPAYDAAKPETVEAYDKAFVGADGKSFNMANLSADWGKNAKVGADGSIVGALSEDTYKFLESKGIDRATVKAVEEGQVAKLQMQRNAVFTLAGGAETYNSAIAWARDGGYTKEAAAKFNVDLNAGGAAQKDAVDLLMTRYKTANPTARRASPQRTTADAANAQGGDAGGPKPYANYKEYQTDLRKARATNDQTLLNESRARLNASPWHTGARS